MTAAEMMQLTALKTTALSAMNACRAVVQSAEAMMMANDRPEPAPNAYSTFDSDDSPTTEHPHGTRKVGRRKLG